MRHSLERVCAMRIAYVLCAVLGASLLSLGTAKAADLTTGSIAAPIDTAALRYTCNPAFVIPGVVELRKLRCLNHNDNNGPGPGADNGDNGNGKHCKSHKGKKHSYGKKHGHKGKKHAYGKKRGKKHGFGKKGHGKKSGYGKGKRGKGKGRGGHRGRGGHD